MRFLITVRIFYVFYEQFLKPTSSCKDGGRKLYDNIDLVLLSYRKKNERKEVEGER